MQKKRCDRNEMEYIYIYMKQQASAWDQRKTSCSRNEEHIVVAQ